MGKKGSRATKCKRLRGEDRWRHHPKSGGARSPRGVRRGGLEASEACRDRALQERDKAAHKQPMRNSRSVVRQKTFPRWRRACLRRKSSGLQLKLSRCRRKTKGYRRNWHCRQSGSIRRARSDAVPCTWFCLQCSFSLAFIAHITRILKT